MGVSLVRRLSVTDWNKAMKMAAQRALVGFFELATVLVCSTIIVISLVAQTVAADVTMPIMFVGDWCYGDKENATTNYRLPSWSDDGLCKRILSIDPWSFYSQDGWNCEPLKVRQKKDCAPSGCAYEASVIARCRPNGPTTPGAITEFKFSRYKGNLYVTEN